MPTLKFVPYILSAVKQAQRLLGWSKFIRAEAIAFENFDMHPDNFENLHSNCSRLQVFREAKYAIERFHALSDFSNLQPLQIAKMKPTLRQCLEVIAREYGYNDFTGLKADGFKKDKIESSEKCGFAIFNSHRVVSSSIYFPDNPTSQATASANHADFAEILQTLETAESICGNSQLNTRLKALILKRGIGLNWWKIARVVVPLNYRKMGAGTKALLCICSLSRKNAFIASYTSGTYGGDMNAMYRFFANSGFLLMCNDDHNAVMVFLPQASSGNRKGFGLGMKPDRFEVTYGTKPLLG